MYLQHWLLYCKNDVPPFVVSSHEQLSEFRIVARFDFYQIGSHWESFQPERKNVNFCKINNILLIAGHKAVGEVSNIFFHTCLCSNYFVYAFDLPFARNGSLGIKIQISGHIPFNHVS